MTARPMEEELEQRLREASLEDAQSSWMDPAPRWATRANLLEEAADALLSLSAEVKGLREALECASEVVVRHRDASYSLNQRANAIDRLAIALAALSPIPTQGDEQARATRSAPTTNGN